MFRLNFFPSLFYLFVCIFILAPSTMAQGKLSNNNFLTNQSYINTINKKSSVDINSVPDVFYYIFNKLPQEVTVYPTENYYYYKFHHNGVPMAGNIRLDVLDRDKGIVHFAYFSQYSRWKDELINKYKQLSSKDGVKVEKISKLRYKITYRNKSVFFNLNNLSKIKPPKNKTRAEEKYIGPVYDESGIQFYLVYNPTVKVFHYILNQEDDFPDILTQSSMNPKIYISTRTGFAYIKDDFVDRLILIGVYEGNTVVNNYFDGPFDQLPDNFLRGEALKEAFIDQRPELKGEIDRFGNIGDGSKRVIISPYIHYAHEYQLSAFTDCIEYAKQDKNAYYSCLNQLEPNDEIEDE